MSEKPKTGSWGWLVVMVGIGVIGGYVQYNKQRAKPNAPASRAVLPQQSKTLTDEEINVLVNQRPDLVVEFYRQKAATSNNPTYRCWMEMYAGIVELTNRSKKNNQADPYSSIESLKVEFNGFIENSNQLATLLANLPTAGIDPELARFLADGVSTYKENARVCSNFLNWVHTRRSSDEDVKEIIGSIVFAAASEQPLLPAATVLEQQQRKDHELNQHFDRIKQINEKRTAWFGRLEELKITLSSRHGIQF
jgi:hypothetical protein